MWERRWSNQKTNWKEDSLSRNRLRVVQIMKMMWVVMNNDKSILCLIQNRVQLLSESFASSPLILFETFTSDFFYSSLLENTLLIASSNTAVNPTCVNAEHSIYLQPKSDTTLFAASYVTTFPLVSLFLMSILFPTNILGELGEFSVSSGYH